MNPHHPRTFWPILIALLLCAAIQVSLAVELPRTPGAESREKALRALAREKFIAKADLDAFLISVGDDGLLLNEPADLLDDLLSALETRTRFSWCSELSEQEFRRYVLPVRVSNEPIQRYRRRLMGELSEQVKSCSTAESAALEVNLWLGQRVTFKPTDRREQGVNTTLACGFGRCGEETILASAALRSIGIAARMVYVPYWAHQNDNHAWVEVKIGDRWKYLGACEPEAALNRAWFDHPVLRAPILLARAADADSTEPDALRGTRGWQINTSRNYFDPCKVRFLFPQRWTTKDEVWLCVYNYGSILPMARIDSRDGIARVELGAGDFLLFGRHNGSLFLQKLNTQFGTEREFQIDPAVGLSEQILCEFPVPDHQGERNTSAEWAFKLDLGRKQSELTQRIKNDTPEWLPQLAGTSDSALSTFSTFLRKAPGNSHSLRAVYVAADPAQRPLLLELMTTLSDKDLREVDSLALFDFLAGAETALSRSALDHDSLRRYVTSPRIAYELPRPWRVSLDKETVNLRKQSSALETAREINNFVAGRIGKYRLMRQVDPLAALLAEKCSESTARVLVCGLLRNAGIPAYLPEGEEWVSFHDGTAWKPLYPSKPAELGIAKERANAFFGQPATLILRCDSTHKLEIEESFSIAPLKDGWPDYYNSDHILEYNSTADSAHLRLVPGKFILSWGQRNSRGDVLLGARAIELAEGERRSEKIPLGRPAEPQTSHPERKIALNTPFSTTGNVTIGQVTQQRPLLVVVLAANHEPSVRMRGLAESLSREHCEVLLLTGPDQKLDIQQASSSLLSSLNIPESTTDFRNGAPYYALISSDGSLLNFGSGYRLDLNSIVSSAIAKSE